MLTIEGDLPVSWRVVAAGEVAPLARQFDAHNAGLLRVLQLIDTSGTEHLDDAAGGGEMHRLEAKLDLVIGLLAELLGREQSMPISRSCRFSAECLELLHEQMPPAIGERVVIELVLNPRLPRALLFVATAAQVVRQSVGAAVTFRLDDLGPQVREELERQIFLLHRRSLHRSGAGGTTRI
ncbi:MAG: PilZ domain-containing protein [Gammaproteobacteria bacterium]|nr:PilZ domain-containing protein [Gammaproteobacteria bacterium]